VAQTHLGRQLSKVTHCRRPITSKSHGTRYELGRLTKQSIFTSSASNAKPTNLRISMLSIPDQNRTLHVRSANKERSNTYHSNQDPRHSIELHYLMTVPTATLCSWITKLFPSNPCLNPPGTTHNSGLVGTGGENIALQSENDLLVKDSPADV
jgi:hypothetical protein